MKGQQRIPADSQFLSWNEILTLRKGPKPTPRDVVIPTGSEAS